MGSEEYLKYLSNKNFELINYGEIFGENKEVSHVYKTFAEYFKLNGTAVDIGCGTGILLNIQPALGLRAAGFKKIILLDWGHKYRSELPPEFELAKANTLKLPFRDELFNLAVFHGSTYFMYASFLNQAETMEKVFREAYRVVKRGGWIVISFSNFRDIVTSMSKVVLDQYKEVRIMLDLNLDFKRKIAIVYSGDPVFIFLQK